MSKTRRPTSIAAPASDGKADSPPQPNCPEGHTPRRVAVADTVSEAALAVMLGVLNGHVPLKHARVAHAHGELAIRGVVVAEEYSQRPALSVPGLPSQSASGEVVSGTQGTSRKA